MSIDGIYVRQFAHDRVFDLIPIFFQVGMKKKGLSFNRNNNDTRDTNLFIPDWTE